MMKNSQHNHSKLFSITDNPIVIAGPCSVETEAQLAAVVRSIAEIPAVAMVRCGVWKPRTRPGGFEGMGEAALRWIATLKKQYTTIRFCCEVASPEQVSLALRYGIDAMWIGARTTVNPFLVGDIAAALSGSAIPVMVKNPVNPDINLWIGALERLQKNGINDIAAIHRGFSTYNNFGYRNNPLWEIPIEFKRLRPDIPLLCDPSHICGQRNLVAPLAQMALDLHFDGLFIECHPDPDNALTDASQQVTPSQLSSLLHSLVVKRNNDYPPSDLLRFRQQLDSIDTQLLQLLSQRMRISANIGAIKRHHNMAIFQPERWQQVLQQQVEAGQRLGLDPQFVKDITEKIHGESIRLQNETQ